MTKLDFESGQKLAEFDFKQIMNVCSEECNGSDENCINDLLEKVNIKEKGIELFCKYKYSEGGNDLDDSDGKNKYIRAIYNILWGRLENSGYNNFRTLFISPKYESEKSLLYSGDTANTVQYILNWENGWNRGGAKKKCKDNQKELYNILEQSDCKELFDCCHYIGNFVLVPAYFNRHRGLSAK